MNNTQSALVELIKASVFGTEPQISEDTDWDEVLKEAKAQTVVSLVYSKIPEQEKPKWEIPSAAMKAHFLRALYEQTKLTKLLDDNRIPFVIIKGTAAAVYYPEPLCRTMGDIDILVKEDYFDTAFELLNENGYKFEHDFADDRDFTFVKDKVYFELHHHYSDKEYDIETLLSDGIDSRRTVEIYGNAFPALPEAVNGLVLLDHIRHHLYGGLGLRQIIDFMLFVKYAYDNGFFESECFPLIESAGLDTLALIIIEMCKMYFGLPLDIKQCEKADKKTAEELFSRLLLSGNFGRKDPYKYKPMQEFTIVLKEKGLFRTLQDAGTENCEAFKKHKILRPFAWIYQSFRYITRGIKAVFGGEKLTGDIAKGKEQFDFFKRLGLK